MMTPKPEKADAWDSFENPAEVFGFEYKLRGAASLRQDLKSGIADGMLDRDLLEVALVELDAIGVFKVAKIVAEFAAKAKVIEETCPHAEGTAWARDWHSHQARRQREREWERKKRQPVLERYGLKAKAKP
jgi:hypothetical protein